jgi:hypothetical protein
LIARDGYYASLYRKQQQDSDAGRGTEVTGWWNFSKKTGMSAENKVAGRFGRFENINIFVAPETKVIH